jgi:hypothetical protein
MEAFMALEPLGRPDELKTEELALAWELADPPAFNASPESDSTSSAVAEPEPFTCGRDEWSVTGSS